MDLWVIECKNSDGSLAGYWDAEDGRVDEINTLLSVFTSQKEANESLGDVPRKYEARVLKIVFEVPISTVRKKSSK